MTRSKPILCVDFDGVIHGYTSGWKGARTIPDPPVPGALEFVVGALDRFQVCILSSRSHQWGGRWAMQRWLKKHLVALGDDRDPALIPEWWKEYIYRTAFADPWREEVDWAASKVIREIGWPLFKPAAMVTIDDRALTFDGTWPTADALLSFKPWNKK